MWQSCQMYKIVTQKICLCQFIGVKYNLSIVSPRAAFTRKQKDAWTWIEGKYENIKWTNAYYVICKEIAYDDARIRCSHKFVWVLAHENCEARKIMYGIMTIDFTNLAFNISSEWLLLDEFKQTKYTTVTPLFPCLGIGSLKTSQWHDKRRFCTIQDTKHERYVDYVSYFSDLIRTCNKN